MFTGIWLEARTHLAIVRHHGINKARRVDRQSYEHKLQLLGISDAQMLRRWERLRAARRELVHEKAHLDCGEVRFAQKEAESAHELMVALEEFLGEFATNAG